MHRIQLYITIILIAGLGVSAPAPAQKKKDEPPPGLEQTTTEEADSLAQQLFGDERDEDRGRREFEKGLSDFEAGEAFLAEADSMRQSGVDTTLKKPGGLIGTFRQALGDTMMSSRELETRKRARAAFSQAAKEFERALKISPELVDAELWLAATYDRLEEWEKAAGLYREILNRRQGDHPLWFRYGYAAYMAGEYDKAVTGFQMAIDIAELVSDDSTQTPNRYRLFAAEAYMRTYQDQLALKMYSTAQLFADSVEAAEIQRTIDWMMWDNGGIATAEYRDTAFQAEIDEDWEEARKAYLGGISNARTQKAYAELTWRLSLIEFQHFSETDALSRLKTLLDQLPDAKEEYRESYGKMVYAHAQTLEKDGDTRGALSYFLQATKINWSGQGAGFIEIARIAANDLDTAIQQAEKSLTYPLTLEQQRVAYQILEESYRARGDWEKMKYYRELLETQN